MTEIGGRCSCGAVEFTFSPESLLAYECHCSICRKATGSAFSTTLMAPERTFSWVHGEGSVASYAKEGGYMVNFCSRCGSPVPNRFRNFPLYCVPVGSLDGSPDITVIVKLHLGSRAQWDKDTFEGKQFFEMPTLKEMLALLHVQPKP